ncbi:hypothetical protein [Streptomyces sp. NPDC048277]|uniref:hypothetical protein n=1 Tax=Streptomyces sp. NPDC048277 TaxID=3155027 RepID=UPI0033C2A30A
MVPPDPIPVDAPPRTSLTTVPPGSSSDALPRSALVWLPGTLSDLYALPPGIGARERLVRIAVQDHIARRARIHP